MSKKVYEKIFQVMSEVGQIKKTGVHGHHTYTYATDVDLVEAIKPLLVKHKLLILPTNQEAKTTPIQKKDKLEMFTDISITYSIIDIDTGESVKVVSCGQGIDIGDKGIYKAITGAGKYLLMKTFFIETSDDPEKENGKGTNGNGQQHTNGKPKPPPPPKPTPVREPGTDGNVAAKTKELLLEVALGDIPQALKLLEELSKFTGNDGKDKFLSSFEQLSKTSDGWQNTIYKKVQTAYKAYKASQDHSEDSYPPYSGDVPF